MNQNMKSLSIAAFALVGMMACVKEIPQETHPEETPGITDATVTTVTLTTTVSLSEDTKALTPEGVKTFAVGDQIAVVYQNTSGNTVKINSEPLTTGGTSATFTVTLTDPNRTQDVTYIYPAAMAKDNGDPNWEALASQDGTLTSLANQLDYATYTGAWNAGALPAATLDNQLAILALTLKSIDGASVINNEISRLALFDGTNSYTVSRTPAEGTIYLAIRPTSAANIQLVAQSASRYYTKSLTDKTYEANNGYPLSFRMAALPEGALPGKFTVASGVQVYFAKGNLQHEGSTWQFAANQWEYYGEKQSPGNDMFAYNGWSDATQVSDGWGVLSQAEWNTLINTRTVSNTLQTGARFTLATLGGSVKGLIVFPDHYVHPDGTGFTAGTYNAESNFTATVSIEGWAKMEMAGCMFIPAAGYNSSSTGWQAVGSAVCVSSTTKTESGHYYTPYFAYGNVDMLDHSNTGTWSSVRMYKGTAPVTGIALSKTAISIPVGSTETITATVSPSGAANPGVSWTSSNPTVATVNAATGEITAVAKGSATITATALDGSGVTATCAVTVIPEGALPGRFTISNDGGTTTSQVYFSRGNLQATYNGTDWTWAFAANQWDYISNAEGNTKVSASTPFVSGYSGSSTTVDLFGWVGASSTWTDVAQYGITSSTATNNTDGYGNNASEALKSDWGNTIGSGWRTLTSAEWQYLFNTRTTGGTVFGTSSARYAHAAINTNGTSVNGMILFPDGVDIASTEVTTAGSVNAISAWATRCTTAQWSALAAKGCVFLPAAGYRNEATVNSAGSYGNYWSSSPYTSDVDYASRVGFKSGKLNTGDGGVRCYGFSVRLVRQVE